MSKGATCRCSFLVDDDGEKTAVLIDLRKNAQFGRTSRRCHRKVAGQRPENLSKCPAGVFASRQAGNGDIRDLRSREARAGAGAVGEPIGLESFVGSNDSGRIQADWLSQAEGQRISGGSIGDYASSTPSMTPVRFSTSARSASRSDAYREAAPQRRAAPFRASRPLLKSARTAPHVAAADRNVAANRSRSSVSGMRAVSAMESDFRRSRATRLRSLRRLASNSHQYSALEVRVGSDTIISPGLLGETRLSIRRSSPVRHSCCAALNSSSPRMRAADERVILAQTLAKGLRYKYSCKGRRIGDALMRPLQCDPPRSRRGQSMTARSVRA